MRQWSTRALMAGVAVVMGSVLWGVSAQQPAGAYRAPRALDGKPDLSGIWQAIGTAHHDIEAHTAKMGPVVALGARGAIPSGLGVVEGGPLPYRPDALAKRKENQEKWNEDPVIKCYMPGVPRGTYMPFPFQIIQSPAKILVVYEYAYAERTIDMTLTPKDEAPVDSWMGWSRGYWEGETLVADVTALWPDTWFDEAGNYHSDALHVVERYTATSPNTLLYEATIEDPKVFTRPWKMSMPLYRRLDKNMELLDFNCVQYADEVMFGHLRRRE